MSGIVVMFEFRAFKGSSIQSLLIFRVVHGRQTVDFRSLSQWVAGSEAKRMALRVRRPGLPFGPGPATQEFFDKA